MKSFIKKPESKAEERAFDSQKRLNYYNELQRRYQELRQANYTSSRIVDRDWAQKAENPAYGMEVENYTVDDGVKEQANWNYRKSAAIKHKILDYKIFPKERISLNCVADGRLITALDKYFSAGMVDGKVVRSAPVDGYYKTPRFDDDNMWLTRSDPITLYFMEPIDKQTLEDIKKVTAPYQNPQKLAANDLVFAEGLVKGAEWMSHLPENQPEDAVRLLKKVEKLNPELADAIYGFITSCGKAVMGEHRYINSCGKEVITHRKIQLVEGDKYTTLYRISAGQHYAVKEAVNNFIRSNSKVMIKSDFRDKISKQL
ncbi:MAG: hypothetical protein J6N45_09490 [Alphaproteobacteria bacterium]|nr:hypothetical protein [Alphaproteobacteria bacterium]